jgi:ABC-type transport system involved in multi-copper enzyme maturation permease subunit
MTTATHSAALRRPGPLAALIRKDLRQYGLVAVLALLVVGGFLVDIVNLIPYYRGRLYDYTAFPLNHDTAMLLTAVIFPLIAAAIGFAQFFFETKPDLWAFFVHRPVSRATLFYGKVAAGLIMFLAVTVIPYTLAVLWQADPAHIPAPFDWSLALPGYLDILHSLAFYFAAVVVARRQARWFGSRIFPLGFPIFTAVLMVGTSQVSIALAVSLVSIALTALAARSVFVAGGFFATQPVSARFSLGVMVVSGLCLLGGVVVVFIAKTLYSPNDYTIRDYRVAGDGTIYLEQNRFTAGASSTTYTDLQGNPYHPGDPYAESSGFSLVNFPEHPYRRYRMQDQAYFQLGASENNIFYFDTRHGCILVYSAIPHGFLGSLGPDGFAPGKRIPGRSFDSRVTPNYEFGSGPSHFVAGNTLYRLSPTGAPAVEALYTAPSGETFVGSSRLNSSRGIRGSAFAPSDRIVIATSARVVVLEPAGKSVLDVPLPRVPGGFLRVVRHGAGDRYTFWYDPRGSMVGRAGSYEFVTADAATGEISRRTAPDIGGYSSDVESRTVYAFMTLAPLAPCVAGAGLEMLDFYLAGLHVPVMEDSRARTELFWMLGYLTLGSLLGVVGAFLVARRHNFSRSRTLAWCLIALAMGIPAVLLMPLLLELPARPPCPLCKKPRPVTADLCPHCGKPFPTPTPNGTEIYDPTPRTAAALTNAT